MSDERAKWINELAGEYVEDWVGEQVADVWQKEVVNLQARIEELEAERDALKADADRYIWLMAHMGRVQEKARQWQPTCDKPLLIYLQDFIDSELPQAGDNWVMRQRELLESSDE